MRSGAITLSPNVIWSGWCIFDIQIGSSFHDERYKIGLERKLASEWVLLSGCLVYVRIECG